MRLQKPLPVLSLISGLCILAALPLAKLGAEILVPGEDLLGYGGVGITIGILLSSFALGFTVGAVAYWRRERPRLLTILVLVLNGTGLLWLLAKAPL